MTVVTKVVEDLSGRWSSAVFSECGKYRYRLDRVWDETKRPFVAGMLNPSTADHEVSDPTVTRVIRRAERGDFGSVIVWNIFAYRATDPADMKAVDDPVGPDNDRTIREILVETRERLGVVMVGWGAHGSYRGRAAEVVTLAKSCDVDLHCLGVTRDGQPRHPLYIPSARSLMNWPLRAAA